jgi:hypothetical protein
MRHERSLLGSADRLRHLRLEGGQRGLHGVDHLHRVGVGLAQHGEVIDGSPLKVAEVLTCSKLSSTLATSRSRTGLPPAR